MANPQQFCAFCGAAGMTKQHIFGKRLLKLLGGRAGDHIEHEHKAGSARTSKLFQGNLWGKKMRRVCKGCNNGWMERLENHTHYWLAQLILGETTIIPAEIQRALAARLALMAMTATLISKDIDPILPQERAQLKDSGTPPEDWRIYLCRSQTELQIGQYHFTDSFLAKVQFPGQAPQESYGQATTSILGKLCVHILARSPLGHQNYSGVRLALLWPSIGFDIDLWWTSDLTAPRVDQLARNVRQTFFPDAG